MMLQESLLCCDGLVLPPIDFQLNSDKYYFRVLLNRAQYVICRCKPPLLDSKSSEVRFNHTRSFVFNITLR